MLNFLSCAIVALILTPSIGAAQDFDAGYASYEDGDLASALREWTPIAEQGDAVAQYNFGLLYSDGEGVRQDDAKAATWYRMASEQGDARARGSLGSSLEG